MSKRAGPDVRSVSCKYYILLALDGSNDQENKWDGIQMSTVLPGQRRTVMKPQGGEEEGGGGQTVRATFVLFGSGLV